MTERAVRLLVAAVVLGTPLAVYGVRWTLAPTEPGAAVTLRARMAEDGGWTPDHLTATVGRPLRLRLTSDDVMHGFAVGRTDLPVVNVNPGQVSEVSLTFTRPGRYVFYCTRWCGVDHWRMRGTIDVAGDPVDAGDEAPPLYVRLGLDLDAPHPARSVPAHRASATRGASLGVSIPAAYRLVERYRSESPAELWRALRTEAGARALSDADVWDLVASVARSHTTPEALQEGRQLYAANCAACHGERGAGDGVMAPAIASRFRAASARHEMTGPADFTDPVRSLGASPALLQGKIVRGGMGTGMPYWGPIFTEAQTWALVAYLQTFQMNLEDPDE